MNWQHTRIWIVCCSIASIALHAESDSSSDKASCAEHLGALGILGSIAAPSGDYVLASNGDYVYLASDGLHVFDLSDPFAPVEVGRVAHRELGAQHAVYHDDYVYVAGANPPGLSAFYVGDPLNPIYRASEKESIPASKVMLRGDYLVLATSAELWGEPGIRILSLESPDYLQRISPDYIEGGGNFDCAMDGHRLLVLPEGADSYISVSLYDPLNPHLSVGSPFTLPFAARTIDVHEGAIAVASSDGSRVAFRPRYGSSGFKVSNPLTDVGSPERLIVSSGMIIAQGEEGVVLVDIMEDGTPRELRHFWFASDARDIAFSGDILVSGTESLSLYLLRPPEKDLLPTVNFLGPSTDFARRATHNWSHLFSAEGANGLSVVDLDGIESPVRVDLPGRAMDCVFESGFVYVANGDGGFHVCDVRSSEAPNLLKSRNFGNESKAIGVDEHSVLYVADTADGLYRFELDDPSAPRALGNVTTEGGVIDFAIAGPRLFALSATGILHEFELREKLSPRWLASLPLGENAVAVAANEFAVFVANGAAGLDVVDVKESGAPTLERRLPTAGRLEDVLVVYETLYGVGTLGGLAALDLMRPLPEIWGGGWSELPWSHGLASNGSDIFVSAGQAGVIQLVGQCPRNPPVSVRNYRVKRVESGAEIRWDLFSQEFPVDFWLNGRSSERSWWSGPYSVSEGATGIVDPLANLVQDEDIRYSLCYRAPYGGNVRLSTRAAFELPIRIPDFEVFPNPANPTVTLRLDIRDPGLVVVRIMTASGRKIRDIRYHAGHSGTHELEWDGLDQEGRPAASGSYYVHVGFPRSWKSAKKVTLLK